MRFYTIEVQGECLPVVSADGGISAFSFADLGLKTSDLADFVRDNGTDRLTEIRHTVDMADSAKAISLKDVKLCAPIMYPDQDVICLGINYDEHALEAGRFSQEAFGGERPYTIYFSKRVNRDSATGESIPAYEGLVDSLDYEVELGVVLGRSVKCATSAEAEKSIFGYTIINDVSARNLQTRHKQWYLGKSLDGFTPMGPCIVTADELGDPANLEISCTINGENRQRSNTRYMIQSITNAIVELSAGMTLKAGTIIATGTPSGVGMGFNPPRFLHSGDVVTCKIENIGNLTNYIE